MFEARLHLSLILSYISSWSGQRGVHFFDFFSGVGAAGKVFRSRGYSIRNFDVEDSEDQDVTTQEGFFLALNIILALVEGGLILLGPPCGLWVFMSKSVHKRTKRNPFGDLGREVVQKANCIVRNVTFLLAVAHYRNIYFLLEQPGSSLMEQFPWISILCEELKLIRVFTWMRCFGHAIPKPSYLLSNLAEALDLRRIWSKKRSFCRRVPWNIQIPVQVPMCFNLLANGFQGEDAFIFLDFDIL